MWGWTGRGHPLCMGLDKVWGAQPMWDLAAVAQDPSCMGHRVPSCTCHLLELGQGCGRGRAAQCMGRGCDLGTFSQFGHVRTSLKKEEVLRLGWQLPVLGSSPRWASLGQAALAASRAPTQGGTPSPAVAQLHTAPPPRTGRANPFPSPDPNQHQAPTHSWISCTHRGHWPPFWPLALLRYMARTSEPCSGAPAPLGTEDLWLVLGSSIVRRRHWRAEQESPAPAGSDAAQIHGLLSCT